MNIVDLYCHYAAFAMYMKLKRKGRKIFLKPCKQRPVLLYGEIREHTETSENGNMQVPYKESTGMKKVKRITELGKNNTSSKVTVKSEE